MKAKHPPKEKREWEVFRASATHLFYREKRAPNDKNELDAAEWDFSKVPESELLACFFHEYGREMESLNLTRSPVCPDNNLACFPELLTTRGVDYNAPWQKLSREVRQKLAEGWTKGRSRVWDIAIFDQLHIQTLDQSEQANVKTINQFRRAHKGLYKTLSPITEEMLPERLSQTEYGFFGINWHSPDKKIKGVFAKWLSDRRADQKKRGLKIECKSTPRGGDNFRDQLRWLGALRIILNHYPTKQLVDYKQQDAKLKIPAPYRYSVDLYKNAKKARKLLNWMAAG